MSETYRVRASSWAGLFDCAHKWEGEHLLGMRGKYNPRALLGNAIHASTAAFDQGRIEHSGATPDDTAGLLVDVLRDPEREVDWTGADLTIREAERIGLTLHTKYCTEVSPQFEFVAVELQTVPLTIDCGNGVEIQLTGTLDRSRARRSKTGGGIGISDLKTGKMAVQKGQAKTKGFAAQLGTYELLYEHSTGTAITEPGEIIGLKTAGTAEIGTGEIHGAKSLMIGDGESPGLIEYAAWMFRTGMFPPNPSSTLCSPLYCGRWATCKYHH